MKFTSPEGTALVSTMVTMPGCILFGAPVEGLTLAGPLNELDILGELVGLGLAVPAMLLATVSPNIVSPLVMVFAAWMTVAV